MEDNKTEEKKVKNTSLRIVTLCCIFILLLVISLSGTFYYYNNLTKSLTGSNKKEISAEEFKAYIEPKGFNVSTKDDVNLETSLKSSSKKAYLTQKNDKEYFRINFFEFMDEASVMYHFYEEVLSIEKSNTGMFTENLEKSLNYTKYSATSNGKYILMSRIKNTLIWGTIDVEHKQDLDNIINALGY